MVNPDTVIDIWHSSVTELATLSVVPDGCRDVIVTEEGEGRAVHVSPLYANTIQVEMRPGVVMMGFRFAPGTSINEAGLLSAIRESPNDIADKIAVFTHLCPNVAEILAQTRIHQGKTSSLASTLGVSERTLQRCLSRETGTSPVFWLQLARARQSALSIGEGKPLCDIAFDEGYADQAHLTREIKRWFGVTPTVLKGRHDLLSQLTAPGF
ncbi:helix-turn-helix domain-containing protein [Enterovibrio sp. ZSDZ35]|uniref:Helix-turn-helix domain-containing protein n=1 Tax=Enterovibrio qingdaonensis TaxID=2899818 RepID=A0ABT5QK75_9GAMM|nr:helix-turn-helix domain-containing protein [Enterovibrio sp. ZSDZ35]MDD1781386.1 helix-turn-helix domain-containing protein [Enterovibrio sp. ZSDZ35]